MSQNNAISSRYFSGQGIVMMATRDVNGNPEGFVNIGNVSNLVISQEQTKEEHKESSTGNRSVDAVLTTETSVTLSMTMEHIHKDNLALGLFGTATDVAAGSVTNEVVKAYLGKTVALDKPNVSSVVVTDDTNTTTYVLGENYTINAEAGSINILDAAAQGAATNPIANLQTLHIDYSYTAHDTIDAFTTSAPERWLRFEGLNTADSNKTVVVDVFKFRVDPFAELALINDTFAQFVVDGEVLSDSTKLTGSKYYKIKVVD